LFLTLIVIADQTQQTSRAAAATEDSLALITRQADLMKEQSDLTVSKERAKLRINLNSFDPFQDVGDTKAYLVRGSVSIYGFSEAFIDGNKIYVALGKAGIEDPLPEWHWSMRLPPVIRQNDPPIQFTALLNGNEGPVTEDEIAEVIDCSVKIYCVAYIEFSDVYGRKWIQRLKQRHTFNNWPPLDSEMAVRMGRWENIGLPSDNGEYAQDQKQN
jgi:hypothetical protein